MKPVKADGCCFHVLITGYLLLITSLFLRFFFVHLVLAAGRAKLFQFKLVRILVAQVAIGMVIEILALRALETNEIVLGHSRS